MKKTEKFALLTHANKGDFCELCNYRTLNKKDFRKHLATRKHLKMSEKFKKSQKQNIMSFNNCDFNNNINEKNIEKNNDDANFLCKFSDHKNPQKKYNKNKNKKKYTCPDCKKEFEYKSWLLRHYSNCPNKNPQICVTEVSSQIEKYVCKKCNKSYKYKTSYDKHIKQCYFNSNVKKQQVRKSSNLSDYQYSNSINNNNNANINSSITEKVIKLLEKSEKTNQKLCKKILDLEKDKKIVNNNINNSVNNNINNINNISYNNIKNGNQVNINLFLNEDCKNAMNLTDFINRLHLTFDDLKYTKDNGYVKGISNIFIKELEDMEITERPIHCTSMKDQEFYVKDENQWGSDKKNEKIDESIDKVARKQIAQIKEWEYKNPGWLSTDEGLKEYMDITRIIMGGTNEDERSKNKELIKMKLTDTVEIEGENEGENTQLVEDNNNLIDGESLSNDIKKEDVQIDISLNN